MKGRKAAGDGGGEVFTWLPEDQLWGGEPDDLGLRRYVKKAEPRRIIIPNYIGRRQLQRNK